MLSQRAATSTGQKGNSVRAKRQESAKQQRLNVELLPGDREDIVLALRFQASEWTRLAARLEEHNSSGVADYRQKADRYNELADKFGVLGR